MRDKLTAKHPRPTTSERAPVRRGTATGRKPVRPTPPTETKAPRPAAKAKGTRDSAASSGRNDTRKPAPPRDAAAKRPDRPARTSHDAAAKPLRPRAAGSTATGKAFGEERRYRDSAAASGEKSRAPRRPRDAAEAGERSRPATGRRDERATRPARSFERDDRPGRSFGRDERPARSFGRDDRPARTFERGERPGGSFARDERPARSFGRDDRPARSFERDDRPARRDGDSRRTTGAGNPRPPRGPSRDDDRGSRPRRADDTGERSSYADRRPPRSDEGRSTTGREYAPKTRAPETRRPREDGGYGRTGDRPAASGERRTARPVKAGYGERAAVAPRGRADRGEASAAPRARRSTGPATGRPREDKPRVPPEAKSQHTAARTARTADTDSPGSLRLSKRMSELGLCSRREADEWIEKGWVYVDGERIDTLGSKVTPDQRIEIDPAARAAQASLVTILLHKPVGYVSGQAEEGYEPAVTLVTGENLWDGDRSGLRFLPVHLRALAPAGRLDIDSTGLLVLTQDGRVAKQLIGEQSDIDKEYLVRVTYDDIETEVDQHFPAESLAMLRHGLSLDDVPLKPAMVSWQNGEQLRFVLREGKKRQIRRMCELVGLKVVGLKRVRIGHVLLGALPQGQWRYLTPDESF